MLGIGPHSSFYAGSSIRRITQKVNDKISGYFFTNDRHFDMKKLGGGSRIRIFLAYL